MADRPEAVVLVFTVQRQVNTDVVAGPAPEGSVAGPRCGHHQAGTRGHPVAQGIADTFVGRVGTAQVVAGNDDQMGIGCVPEALGEAQLWGRCHRGERYPAQPAQRPRFEASAARAASTKSSAWATFGGIVRVLA